MITFTGIPNILKIKDDDMFGTRATAKLVFADDLPESVERDGQYYITLLGETITNVTQPQNAINKNFFISTDHRVTATYVAKALRNCPNIASNFDITQPGLDNYVLLTAKSNGVLWSNLSNYFKDNMEDYLTLLITDGSSEAAFYGTIFNIDIFKYDAENDKDEYITTLEKNFYGSELAFNLSPVLTTIAEYGKTVPYKMVLSYLKYTDNNDATLNALAEFNNLDIMQGYVCNQGKNFITRNVLEIAQNVSRGNTKGTTNNTTLYVYKPEIDISFFVPTNTSAGSYYVRYLDSALNEIYTYQSTWRQGDSSKHFIDLHIDLDNAYFKDAFYVDIEISNNNLRYTVIKPLKATEYCQRIYFRNSYGGISFFDFTGEKTETRELSSTTYKKSIYDYYEEYQVNSLEKVYDKDITYKVKLKSHLFDEDGKYLFNDMLQSPYAWTTVNGREYEILIDSISVEEQDNNNIYQATITYKYSQEPTDLN